MFRAKALCEEKGLLFVVVQYGLFSLTSRLFLCNMFGTEKYTEIQHLGAIGRLEAEL